MMPLALAPTGTPLRLEALHGGLRLRQRLADLGLTPGVVLRLVQNDPSGPLILALRDDSRLALGRGMACQIMVAAAEDSAVAGAAEEDTAGAAAAAERLSLQGQMSEPFDPSKGAASDALASGAALDAAPVPLGGHR
jgi:ferrous iron transport protein A